MGCRDRSPVTRGKTDVICHGHVTVKAAAPAVTEHQRRSSSTMGAVQDGHHRRWALWLVVCVEFISATVNPSDREIPIHDSLSQVECVLHARQHPFGESSQRGTDGGAVRSHTYFPHALQMHACGSNHHGQLGIGDRLDRDAPWPLAFGPYSATV